ncbi:MAG: hypothetical protein HEQ33_20340 [Dolichospermum sp. WA123]|nr:hypothetical protein [Dolichospermum sp. WA123]
MGQVFTDINNAINPFYKDGGNGDDDFTIYGGGVAYGNGGNDTLRAYAIYVKLDGGDGNDRIHSYSGGSELYGGWGNDYIEAYGLYNKIYGGGNEDTVRAYGGYNEVHGEDGHDNIVVWGAANRVYGGGHNDYIEAVAAGNWLYAGWGEDTIRAYGGYNEVHGEDGHDNIVVWGAANRVYGGGHNDYIEAVAAGNWLYAGWGEDTIRAYGGYNEVHGEDGHDNIVVWGAANRVYGGGHNDYIEAVAAGNWLYAGWGEDTIRAYGGYNEVHGEDGHDNIVVWGAANRVYGGGHNDYIEAVAAGNWLYAGWGEDTIRAYGGYNEVHGEDGHDNIVVWGAANRVYGGGHNDYIEAVAAGNWLYAGWGEDTIRAYGGYNEVHGEDGHDNIVVWGAANRVYGGGHNDYIEAVAAGNWLYAGWGEDTIRAYGGYNEVHGEDGHDNIVVWGAANRVYGGGHNDYIEAVAAGNWLYAGWGEDTIRAYGGYNEVHGEDGHDNIVVWGAANRVYGGGHNDYIEAVAAGNWLYAGWGEDTIRAYGGYNEVHGEDGHDNIVVWGAANRVYGGGHNDYIEAVAAGNWLYAGWGEDTIRAYGGANIIDSDDDWRNDNIEAYGGANIINAGSGSDRIIAGGGANIINAGSGNNNIETYGVANIINAGSGNLDITGAGVANVITHTGTIGNTSFIGGGGANVITHSTSGNITFNGGGVGNIITHSGVIGNTSFNGGGLGNIIVHRASGNVTFNGGGLANVVYHGGNTGDIKAVSGGLVNVFVRNGNGLFDAELSAAGNISVHVGHGDQRVLQLGGLNTHTHVGNGNAVVGMAGGLNVATFVGNGSFYGGFLGAGNVLTKVGTGHTYIAAIAAGNVLTHVDNSNNYSNTAGLLLGGANILTKAGNGELLGIMGGGLNVATHVGKGDVTIAQLGGGNILTKVGDGNSMSVQFGIGNINTQVGNGTSLGLMAGAGNIYTKVGNGLSAAGMLGMGNIYTHVGSGDSLAVMAAKGNIFTKVEVNDQQPNDITAAAMFGGGNIFTHVGNGITGALMLSMGNVFTKVGEGATVAAMGGKGNIATHVGNGSTFAAMAGMGNVFTKVGNGTTAALMAAKGNVLTHVGNGNTIGLTAGQANLITKVGQGDQINVAFGKANISTHVSTQGNNNNSYNAAMGDVNIITKVGDGKQVNLLSGKANIVTHVGNGDDVNLALGGEANIVTKVGDGNTINGIINSKLNIVTHVGDGDNLQGLWGNANIVTKVGDGTSSSAMKGDGNVVTVVGDGAQVGVLFGQGNIVTKVGDGTSVNILKGTANIVTKVGDGTSIGLMKGTGNINTQIGDGHTVFAAYANNNISIKIGDGDYYGFTIAPDKSSLLDKAKSLGQNLLQTAGGFLGSEVISQLVWGSPDTTAPASQKASPEDSLEVAKLGNTVNFSFNENTITGRVGTGDSNSYATKQDTISITEPTPSSNLNENNVKNINNNNQQSDMAASGSLAGQAGTKLQQGVNQVRSDLNSLLDKSEQILGNGGEVTNVLANATNTLVGQLSVLDNYIHQGDDLLFGGSKPANNGTQKEFAQGTVGRVNSNVNTTLNNVNGQLKTANQNVSNAEIEITKVKLDAAQRQTDAQVSQSRALSAQNNAQQQQIQAQNRINQANNTANSSRNEANAQVSRTQSNAAGEKRSENNVPSNRQGATGSGLDNQNVKTQVTVDDSFADFSDGVINQNKENTLSSQQKDVLQKGVSQLTIASFPYVVNNSTEEEEEEETGGQYDKIPVGRKSSWKESQELQQWTDGDNHLKANLRGKSGNIKQITEIYTQLEKLLETDEGKAGKVFKNYKTAMEIAKTIAGTGSGADYFDKYATPEQFVLSALGINSSLITAKLEAQLKLPSQESPQDLVAQDLLHNLTQAFETPEFEFKGILNFKNDSHEALSSDFISGESSIQNKQDIQLPIGKEYDKFTAKASQLDADGKLISGEYNFTKGLSLIDKTGFKLTDTGLKYKTFAEIAEINPHIAASLLDYRRQEGVGYEEIFGQNSRTQWETIYAAATAERSLDAPNDKSINHILADSAIASILHKLAAEAIAKKWDVSQIEPKVKPFLVSLDNLGIDNQSNPGQFADKAIAAFTQAVTDDQGNFRFDRNKLYEATHTISYAPGNIRWGDAATNTKISNFFDPIFKLDNGTIQLDESSRSIYDAVQKLSTDGSITSDQFNLATKLATATQNGKRKLDSDNSGSFLSSSKVIGLENSDYKLEVIQDGNNTKIQINGTNYHVEKSLGDRLTDTLKANVRGGNLTSELPSSGLEKTAKRTDYEDIHTSTNEQGDKLKVYKIIHLNGGEPLYRLQIDIDGDASKRISIFSSVNPVQADGSIRLPQATTIVSHGKKLEGQTYTSKLENHYITPDDKYLTANINDFRNIENIETAESKAANSTNNNYLLTKYREKDEGLGIDMSKNQEQIILATLRDRADNGKPQMGYLTVGKHAAVTSQQVDAALSRLSKVVTVTNGYCRAVEGTSTEEDHKAKPKDLTTHHNGESEFLKKTKQTIEYVASVRRTDLEGRRNNGINKLVKHGEQIERKPFTNETNPATGQQNGKFDTSGNLQIQVGDGEFTAAFWGNTNIGVKVGDGGFKAGAFGDNNIFVHIGDGDTAKHTQNIGGYNAFEGAQLFIGQRNVSFNYGVSNDFIVMLDKSIPLPPFQSPFSGPTDIVGYLKNDIAKFNVNGDSNDIDPLTGDPIEDNYYDSQNYLWSQGNAQQIVNQISSLDMNSSVEYETLFDYGSESDRNTRALQADTERALNKGFSRMLAGGSPFKKAETTPLKDQNFNLTIAGQGADIILTNGDNQFMFGDNIPSLLDTTIASVFGMLSQETNGENGQVGNTMSYDPRNFLGQFLNQLISRVSASLPDLTIGEALGLAYDAQGKISKIQAQRLSQADVEAVVQAFAQFASQNAQQVGIDLSDDETGTNFDVTNPRHLLGLFAAFGNGNLGKFIEPERLLDHLKSALDLGEDALNTFRDRLVGSQPEATDNTSNTQTTPTDTSQTNNPTQNQVPVVKSSEVFGFGGLKLPSLFDIDIPAIFKGETNIINDMVGLVNSFDGDIETMQEQMFDFFANSGYMQQDGDLLVSLGNNNFTWGGDGNDLVGLMGLNNNFWGGRGNDMYYGMGENNQGSGNEGDDTAVLIGINNLFFGGQGNDFALAAGRNANLTGDDGDDTMYVLGSDSWLNGGKGEDYLVAVGNNNAIQSGDGNDYAVYIGNYADVDLGTGQDVLSVFGNKNIVRTGDDGDYLRIIGHQGEYYAGGGNDFIWTDIAAQGNIRIQGDAGDDTFVLGGLDNTYYGGEGHDSFIISNNYESATIQDISTDDRLIFANVADSDIWFEREQDDLFIYLQGVNSQQSSNLLETSKLTIANYFAGHQAHIVVDTVANIGANEVAYEALTQEGLADLIQIMSTYNVLGSGEALLNDVTVDDLQKLATGWENTVLYQGPAFML